MPRTITKLVGRAAACEHLGICPRTFSRHWANVFTDPRGPESRAKGAARRVYEDELAAAVDGGGGVEQKAKNAVYRVRSLMNRR